MEEKINKLKKELADDSDQEELVEETAEDYYNKKQQEITQAQQQQLQESKEFVSIKTSNFELTLGSCFRPVEFLCNLSLEMKEELNNHQDGKEKPNYLG